jgi:hypothetical protein
MHWGAHITTAQSPGTPGKRFWVVIGQLRAFSDETGRNWRRKTADYRHPFTVFQLTKQSNKHSYSAAN